MTETPFETWFRVNEAVVRNGRKKYESALVASEKMLVGEVFQAFA